MVTNPCTADITFMDQVLVLKFNGAHIVYPRSNIQDKQNTMSWPVNTEYFFILIGDWCISILQAAITALSFNTDGKNLVTYSAPENKLSFWQTR